MALAIQDGAIGRSYQRDGEPVIVEVLGAGLCACLTDQAECRGPNWSLVTLLPTSVLQLPLATLRIACMNDARLLERVHDSERKRQRALLARLLVLSEHSSPRRVAGTLLYLINVMGAPCPLGYSVCLPLPQHVLAAVGDMARQTLNRELRRLQRGGILRVERSMVCIADMELLSDVARGRAVPRPPPDAQRPRRRYPDPPLDLNAIALNEA